MKNENSEKNFENLFQTLKSENSIESLNNIFNFIKENSEDFYNTKIQIELQNDFIKYLLEKTIDINIQMNIFKYFIDLIIDQKYKKENLYKITFIFEIFNLKYEIYNNNNSIFSLFDFLEKYYEFYFPLLEEQKDFIYEEKTFLDYLLIDMNDNENYKFLWIQAKIKKIEENEIVILNPMTKKLEKIVKNSWRIRPKNTFTYDDKDLEFRKNLKENDIIDAYDNNKNWFKSTIKERNSDLIEVSFNFVHDDNKFYGLVEKYNKWFNIFSPCVRKLKTFSFDILDFTLYDQESSFNNVYNENNMHIPFNGKNFVLPSNNDKKFSMELIQLFNYFIENLLNKEIFINEKLSLEYFNLYLNIFKLCCKNLHFNFTKNFVPEILFKAFKRILDEFSLNKNKQFSKVAIENLFKIMKDLLLTTVYMSDLDVLIGEFELQFGYNCFTLSENFEKKLLGISILSESLKNNVYCIPTNKLILISDLLINKEKDIFDLLYGNNNIHIEILKKSKDLLDSLFKLNVIEEKDIEKLYNYIISSKIGNKDIKEIIYDVLNKNCDELSYKIQISLINKIKSYPEDQLDKDDLYLLIYLTKNIKSNCRKNMENTLNYLYEYIFKDIDRGVNFLYEFSEILSSAKENDIIYLYISFVKKLVDDLISNNKDLNFILLFISKIIYLIPEKKKNELKIKLKYEIFTGNNIYIKINEKFLEYCLTSLEKQNKFTVLIFENMFDILYFTEFDKFFDSNLIKNLFDIFIFNLNNFVYKNDFIKWIDNLTKNELININLCFNEIFEKLNKFLIENKYSKEIFDENYLEFFYNLFISYNKNKSIENPLKYENFLIIWEIFLNFDYSFYKNFLKILALRTLEIEERFKIWKEFVSFCFENIEKNKNNNNYIENILNILNIFLNYSEIYGTGNCISHKTSLKTKFNISLKIINNFYKNCTDEITINENIFNTSTIYDLKKRISEILNIPIFLFEINKHNLTTIQENENGKILQNIINFKDEEESKIINQKNTFRIYPTKKLNLIEEFPLIENNDLTERAKNVFIEIFYKIANKDSKIDNSGLLTFISQITGQTKVDSKNKNFIEMSKYKENDGLIDINGFLKFYYNSSLKNEKTVRNNLRNFDYRNDLMKINSQIDKNCDLFYNENNKREFMPKFFISNDLNYFNKILELLENENEEIQTNANKLIEEIETNENIFNYIMKNNIENILNENNLNKKIYSFEIILGILEKKSTNENESKWKKDFINFNFLKLFYNFLTYENEKISNNFVKFYTLNLRIILICICEIINNENKEFINDLKKINELKDDNNSNKINKHIIILNEENFIFEQFDFIQFMKIIVNIYFNIPKENTKVLKFRKEIVNSILQLFSICFVLNFDNENDNINILYETYFNYVINNIKLDLLFANKNNYLFNKFILIQLKNKNSFTTKFEEKIRNELLNLSNIYSIKSSKYLFNIYEDILELIQNFENEDELEKIFFYLNDLINKNDLFIKEDILTGYVNIMKNILIIYHKNNKKIENLNENILINNLIDNFLITDINIENENKNLYSNYNSFPYIKSIYELITGLIYLNPEQNIHIFFENKKISNINNYLSVIIENKKENNNNNEKEKEKEKEKNKYNPFIQSKSKCGYLGINNLGSICYMISVIQQFYMIPLFKRAILTVDLPNNVDNVTFQLQKMFSYLTFSKKQFYDPKDFVFSFKDYDGNPTNPLVQCDAQEFLGRFINQIEDDLKNTNYKYILNNIFGGEIHQILTCQNPDCNLTKTKKEVINFLSLDIKNCSNLNQCLAKYIQEENIDDYNCEKCKLKVSYIKNVLINKLPNILIIHLQRIAFNYQTFELEKINTKVDFSREINLKNYTTNLDNNSISSENFEYFLIGVLVHSGTAQYGHYFSLINTKNEKNKWVKFNDKTVIDYNANNLEIDTFGGEKIEAEEYYEDFGESAYMLIYEKKIKNYVMIKNDEINENECEKFKSEKDVFVNVKNVEKNGKNVFIEDINEKDVVFNYDDAFDYINKMFDDDKKIKFYNEIIEENIKFSNDKKIYVKFFKDFLDNVNKQLISLKEKIDEKEFEEKYKKYEDFILKFM